MFGHAVAAKVIFIATGTLASLGGVSAAAATGNLPGPTQEIVATAVSNIGVEIPSDTTSASDDTVDVPETTTTTSTTLAPAVEDTTTTTTPVVTTPKPGAETCAAAREAGDDHGCSEIAHEHAPGQVKKEDGTHQSGKSDKSTSTTAKAKSENSGKGKSSTTSTSKVESEHKSGHGESEDD